MMAKDYMSVYFQVKGADKAEKDLKNLGAKGTLALTGLTASTKPVSSALLALNSTIGKVSSSMNTFAGAMGAYLGFQGIQNTIGGIVNTNAELQKLAVAMEVAEGSSPKFLSLIQASVNELIEYEVCEQGCL